MKKLGAVRCGIDQRGRGFHTVRGGIDPGDLSYRLRVVGVVEICKDSHPGMRPCPPRERRDLGDGPGTTSLVRAGMLSCGLYNQVRYNTGT